MKKISLYIAISAVFFAPLATHAQSLTADDFLPPVSAPAEQQEELTEISGEVSTVEDTEFGAEVVEAETTQDAINHVVSQSSSGAQMIRVGSGIGWVATGIGTYSVAENPTATRIARRNAYVRAYMDAQRYLASTMSGLTSEGKTRIMEAMTSVSQADGSMTNFSGTQEEMIEQSVQMLMSGFVVYSVDDNPDQGLIHVSIVTTPKTRGQVSRVSQDGLEAASLNEGVNYILTEIQSSLIPPVGGRIVQVPSTEEIAFVGYGSDVIRTSDNPTLQVRQRLNAERVAQSRAADALTGVIIGDNTSWRGQVDEQTITIIEEYEELEGELGESSNQRFEETRQRFINTQSTTDEFQSFRSGVLPPGVMSRTFLSDDGAEVYAVSVYLPSLSNMASQAAQEMSNSKIVENGDVSNNEGQDTSSSQVGNGTVSQGATGQVSDNDDL